MVTFLAVGEKPNRDGVVYVAKLLKREGLVDDYTITEKPREDKIYVIGDHSGTYSILRALKPPAVLSVDAHTDLMQDYFDHASWLAYALKDRIVERASVIGAVLMIPTTERTKLWTRNVRIFPALPRTRRVRGRWRRYMNLEQHGLKVIDEARRFLGDEIYLTIDLDVLRPEYRIARFQHGELTLKDLLEILEKILRDFTIVAVDIAEVSDRVARSKLGRRAVIEVFSLIREVVS
ncbi:arginase [Thermococcus chitonophagus]|uniref:Arginase n=1 Tax=Thermococcus chitonophagus TaxID=54262 RepID=A0A160VSU9_9EURY|nr:arginase family protein [Thermococcus chitonophagus]ASJ17347.1 arginase [Thermococcus chitonophagus]CUX77982.1 Arginase [Thermococcus chitonophagus]